MGFGAPGLLRLVNRPLVQFGAHALRHAGLSAAVVVAGGSAGPALARAADAPAPWSVSLADPAIARHPWSDPVLSHPAGRLLVAVEADAVPGPTLSSAVTELRHSVLGALFVVAPDGEVVAGVLRQAALQVLASIPASVDAPSLAGACRSLEAAGVPLRIEPSDEAWRWSGEPAALLEAHRRLLDQLALDPPAPRLAGPGIQGAVFADPSAEIEDAVLRGPIVVGPGARISSAYIGPYTAISDDAVIEGAEVEHSIVLPGASICYPGRRLEGSIVGPRARVFRSFALPEALRVTLGPAAEVGLA